MKGPREEQKKKEEKKANISRPERRISRKFPCPFLVTTPTKKKIIDRDMRATVREETGSRNIVDADTSAVLQGARRDPPLELFQAPIGEEVEKARGTSSAQEGTSETSK